MQGGFSNPERIIRDLEVKKDARIADFGSGSGYFTLLLAKIVGPSGTVVAVDVLTSALGVIKSRAQDQGLYNINYIRGNLETEGGSTLLPDSQDMVFLANILFQSQQKEKIMAEAKRVLKVKGRLVIIDWMPSAVFGPKEEGWKFSSDEGKALAEGQGFSFVKDIKVSISHWGLLFNK